MPWQPAFRRHALHHRGLINRGFDSEYFVHWFRGFLTARQVAFPTVLVVAPFVRRVVARITA